MDTNSRPVPFEMITENVYLNDTTSSRDKKRAKKMVCECQFDPEMDDPETACGEDCLNRLLLIECSSRCPCGEYCTNKRFQRAEYAKVEVFKTEMKGWGLRALIDLPKDMFVMEYCGEVCSLAEFEERKKVYSMEKRRHYYFMSLKADDILDATHCGNMSRFINHSCDPNCETQKWTVEGRLRIGFFTLRHISAGEELTFDYQFQRFGEATAQRCYCGAANCRGYLGVGKPSNRHQQQSSPRSSSASPLHRKEKKRKDEVYVNLLDPDALFEKQVYDIVGSSWRLMNSNQVLAISRAMIHAETSEQRNVLLKVLQATEDEACLKKFLSLQGLRLLWSWMVDSCDMTGKQQLDFRMSLLTTLKHLPIATKNQIEDNKLLMVVQKWLQEAQQAGSVPRKTPKTTISKKNVDITVTEADSVQCPPTSCDESQHEEVKPDTNSMTIPPSSTRENKENSGIKAEEKLTQKDDSTSQELVDPIQSKNNVSLKNDDQKETQEEGIKDNVKTEAVECDKLTVEDVKDIVNDTVTKDSHIDIKESPEDDNNMNKETVVAQKEEAEVGSMKEIVATEQELTEGDIVKQAENDEDNKLEQIITEQRDTHHSEEDITQKVGEDLKGLEEHMQMEQVEKDMNTSQSEGDVMTQEEDSSSMKTELGVVALIKEPVEKMEDETPRDIDIVCVETSDTTNEISDQSKDTVDIPTDISDVPTDLVTIPKDAIDIPVDTSDIPKDAVNTPIHTGDMPLDTNDAVKELDNTAKEIDNTQIKTYEITNLADTLEHTDDVPKETAGMQIETSYILQDTCTDGTLKLSSDGVVEKTGHMQTETDSTLKQMDDTVSGTVEPPKDTDNGLKLGDGIAKEIDDVQMETNETLIEMEASTENGETSTSVDCTSLDTVDAQETDSNIPSNTGGMYTEIYEETVEASTKIGGEVTTDIADTLIDHTQREIDSSMLSTGGILEHKDENNTAGIANTVQWIGYTPAGVVDPHKDMNDVMKTETSDLQTETDITTDDILKQTDDTPKQTGDTQTEGGNPPQQPVDAQKDTGDTAKGIEDMWKQPGSMLSEDTLKQVHVSNQQEDVDDITEQKGDTPVDTWKQPDGTLDQSGDTLIQEVSIPVQEVDVPVQEIDIPVQEVDIPVQEVYIPVQGVEMPMQVCDTLQDIHDTPIDTGDTLKQPVGMPEQSNNASKQTDDVPMQVGSRLEQKVDTLQDIDDIPIDAGDTLKQTDSMQIEMILVIKVEDMAKETGNAQVEIQEDTESGKDDVQNLGEDESNKHSETVCQAADGLVPMEDYFKSGAQTEQDGLRYETDTTQEDSVQQAEDSVTAVDNGGEVPAFADNASLLLQGDPADMSVEESDTQAEKGVGVREDETIPQEIIGQLQREIEMEQGKVDMGESSMAKEEADTQTANDEELTGIGDDKEDMIPKEEVDMQTDSNEETIIPKEDVITEGNKEVTVPSNNVDMQNYLHTESIKECNIPKEEVDMQTENSKEIIIREDFYMHTEGIKESTIPKEEFDIRAENKTESIVPMESIHVEAEGGKEDIVSEKDTHLQTEDTKEGVIPKEDVDMQTEGIKESIVLEGNVDMETENDKEPNIPKESADMGLEDDTKDSVIPKEDVTEEYSTHKENDKRHEMSENEQEDGQDTDSIISTISDTTISLDQDDTEGMTDTQDPEWMIDDKDDPPSSCESTEETHEDSDTVVSSQITVGRDSEPNTETSTVEAIPISSSTQSEQETFPTSTSEKEATPAPVCQPDQQARKQVQQAPVSDSTSIPESCEAEGREMIKSTEELEREQALCLAKLAHDLLEQWSDLKEVYRIPKRSSPPPAKRRRSHSYHRRHSRSPSPDSDLELRMRRRQRRREGSTTDRWFRQGSYHRNSNRRLQARPRRYHWDSTDSRTQSSSSQAETYNSGDNSTTKTYNTAIQQGTIQQTTIQQGTIPQATIQQQQQGYSTYDQLVQQQQLHQQQLQQQQLQQQQQQLQQQQQQQTQQAGTTAGISLQCYPQSLITTGLVPLKPQAVNQQTQQQPQPLMQQLALPAMSQGNTAGISGVPLATGQLYGSQILFQPTQVSNFYPATPSNLPPLPPPPTVLAAAAAAAATNTLSTVEAVAQNQLLPNPIAPLQLQALPVYQPQAAVIQQQQQAGNSAIVSQQQGGGAVIQQGYLQQGILPGQLRPLDQLQQSGGMLIQQQCYVPTTAAITGLATLPLPPPPPVSSEEKGLPENWRTARDPAGKIYYYHCITKKTQWERPAANDTEGTLNMDISNSDHSGNSPETSPVQNIVTTTTASTISASSKPSEATESLHTMVIIQDTDSIPMPCDEPQDSSKPKVVPLEIAALIADAKVSRSSSPYGKGSEDGEIVDHTEMDTTSQETVTTETTSTTAAVATDVVGTPNKGSENTVLSKDAALARDHFKHNMSKLVIQCLQYHRKPGCKYGLITNSEDFKHLARKLTHGLTEKEAYHKKGYEKVEFNDSVKTKTKEYIRNYMKKFGPIYSRT